MVPKGPLDESASVTLDGSGNGTAKITCSGTRHGDGPVWHVKSVSVVCSTNTQEAQALLYLCRNTSIFSSADFVSQSLLGSTGDTCGLNTEDNPVLPNDYLIVRWLGGDVGAIATMTVKGTILIGEDRP